MGKILFTNSDKWKSYLGNLFKNQGFPITYEDRNAIIFRKKYVENINVLTQGNNFVACVGTWEYNGLVGKEGMKLIFNDSILNNFSIKDIRKYLNGTFAVAIKKDNIIKIFVDETHTYALYYYCENNKYLITNTYYHIAKMVRDEFDERKFKMVLATRGISSNSTIFKNIFRLMEYSYIEINLSKNNISVCDCEINNYKYRFDNTDTMINMLQNVIEESAIRINRNSKLKNLFVTGGVDSRLKLSLDLYLGADVQLAYWGGKNDISNGTYNDKIINRKLAYLFGLKTKYYEFTEQVSESIEQLSIKECDKYGEYALIYAHNMQWLRLPEIIHNSYEDVDEIELGYDPDILREIGNIEASYKKGYSLEDLIKIAFLRSGVFGNYFEIDNDLIDIIHKDILSGYRDNNLEISQVEDAVNIFNYCKLDMGSTLINFFNEYFFCCNLMYTKPIWDFAKQIPASIKNNSHLSLLLIKKWKSEALDVPIFSHNHFVNYDQKSGRLKKTIIHTFFSWLKSNFGNSIIYDYIYLNHLEKYFFPESKSNDDIFQFCRRFIEEADLLDKLNIHKRAEIIKRKGFDLPSLAYVAAYIKLYILFSDFMNAHVDYKYLLK